MSLKGSFCPARAAVIFMNYEHELDFLCDVLEKCHIRTSVLSEKDTADAALDSTIRSIIGINPDPELTISKLCGAVENNTEYKFKNELMLHYIFMKLPTKNDKNLLFIGPYLASPLSSEKILEIGEGFGLSTGAEKNLKEYYFSLPVIGEDDRIFSLIDTFCERIFTTRSFSIVEISNTHTFSSRTAFAPISTDDFDGSLADAEMMEMRYAFENELIMAVMHGQQHKEKLLSAAFSEQMFERRLQDPVRNAKNYCIIMNTLLRKAAEQGGVHPIYIDRISSKFAKKIELVSNIKSVPELMGEIFSTYCRLVRKHTTKPYSPIVKKTVLMIDSDISAELSLRALAKKQGISPGYLATVFKRETGKTVSEYVRDRRINHALHLLATTNLQIQTVAMHCGIMDVQYFSKLFKRQLGKTPKEYRDSLASK